MKYPNQCKVESNKWKSTYSTHLQLANRVEDFSNMRFSCDWRIFGPKSPISDQEKGNPYVIMLRIPHRDLKDLLYPRKLLTPRLKDSYESHYFLWFVAQYLGLSDILCCRWMRFHLVCDRSFQLLMFFKCRLLLRGVRSHIGKFIKSVCLPLSCAMLRSELVFKVLGNFSKASS